MQRFLTICFLYEVNRNRDKNLREITTKQLTLY